jgi:hypothetical protein
MRRLFNSFVWSNRGGGVLLLQLTFKMVAVFSIDGLIFHAKLPPTAYLSPH